MKKLALLTVLLLFASTLSGGAAHAQSPVVPYPLTSAYTASTLYSLRVNNTAVPVASYTGYEHAGLAASGPLTIEVTALGLSSISSYNVSPRKLNVAASVSGNRLTFSVQRDEYLIVKIGSHRELVIAADPPETDRPASSGAGIFNIRDYGTGTAAFQRALDDASTYGTAGSRGVVYVPAGVYPVGNLVLKSDTTLYLERGAVLRATAVKSDYTMHWHKDSINLDVTWWLRTEYGSNNIRVHGRGYIDGNGRAATSTGGFANNLLVPIATSNFSLDGITFRDAGSWAVTPIRSNDLSFTNMKIYNRFDVGEDDGIDVMESQRVTVRNAIGIGLDDPFSTKTWAQEVDISRPWPGTPERLDEVTFDDLLSWTICYGVKVGAGVIQDQSRVIFRNGVVYNAAIGIGVHQRHGAARASQILFENFDVERLQYTNAGYNTWLRLSVEDAQSLGGGTLAGVTVRNVTVRDRGKGFGVLRGHRADNPVTGVVLDDIRMPGQSTPVRTLAAMNIYDRAHHTPVTIRPVQDPEPPQRTNLALGRPGTASSATGPVAHAFDGHYGTRWGSTYADPAWIQVDLGSHRQVNGVQLAWEVAYGRSYTIQVSDDGSSWTQVYGTTSGDGGIDRIDFATTTARYVRMHGTQRGTQWGYSLWEFEVYGTTNLALNQPSSASSAADGTQVAQAFDGNTATRWASARTDPQWIQVDLGRVRSVTGAALRWEHAFGQAYEIRVSDDGITWRTTHATSTGDGGTDEIAFAATPARYVRMHGTARGTQYGYSLWEFEVHGPTTAVDEPLRVMPLGDSITDGYRVPGGYRIDLLGSRWSIDFVGSMRNGPLADQDHEGHIGWRIDQMDARVSGWIATYRPDVVLLHLGTNDISQRHDLVNAPARLGTLIDKISLGAPQAMVHVATIINSPTSAAQTADYNRELEKLVRAKSDAGARVVLVDQYHTVSDVDIPDGVHPNAIGFSAMARRWLESIDRYHLMGA